MLLLISCPTSGVVVSKTTIRSKTNAFADMTGSSLEHPTGELSAGSDVFGGLGIAMAPLITGHEILVQARKAELTNSESD